MIAPDVLAQLRKGDLVDYVAVAQAKLAVLRRIWDAGRRSARSVRGRRRQRASTRHALFEALSANMVAEGHGAGWLSWPAAYHDADGKAVRDFRRDARA